LAIGYFEFPYETFVVQKQYKFMDGYFCEKRVNLIEFVNKFKEEIGITGNKYYFE